MTQKLVSLSFSQSREVQTTIMIQERRSASQNPSQSLRIELYSDNKLPEKEDFKTNLLQLSALQTSTPKTEASQNIPSVTKR